MNGSTSVTVDGCPLKLRLELRNHSPTGFDWGYCGSGPAQLALALLADALGDDEVASSIYQDFKQVVISKLSRDRWALTSEEILHLATPLLSI